MNHRTSLCRTAIHSLLLAAAMAVQPAAQAAPALVNGGFEAGTIQWSGAWGAYCYSSSTCAATGWTGAYLLTSVGSWAWGYPYLLAGFDGTTQGSVVAGLQGSAAHVQQTVHIDQAGRYTLSWRDAGRPSGNFTYYAQDYNVLMGGTVVGSYHTGAGQAWATHALTLDLLAGDQVLDFKGLSALDATSFLDSVALDAAPGAPVGSSVPEPATLALTGLAVVAAGAARRRSGAVTVG